MGIGVVAPRSMVEKKPPHGSPCNRCGLCCATTRCPLAMHVLKLPEFGRCPALSFDEGGSVCGLAERPQDYAPFVVLRWGLEAVKTAARHLIGSGTGCDARVNGEKPNAAFYEKLREHDRRTRSRTKASLKIWGIK